MRQKLTKEYTFHPTAACNGQALPERQLGKQILNIQLFKVLDYLFSKLQVYLLTTIILEVMDPLVMQVASVTCGKKKSTRVGCLRVAQSGDFGGATVDLKILAKEPSTLDIWTP